MLHDQETVEDMDLHKFTLMEHWYRMEQ
ncbi:Protein of unknown function [Escherichia coli]|nr:Protein of unknown function [Escherichia coli]CDU37266.1 Protein of unknown function [Escherichia coli]